MGTNLFGESERGDCNAAETLATLDSAVLHDAAEACVRAGWMLSISASRDGFALRLAIMRDGERDAVWLEDAASAERALQGLQAAAMAVLQGTEGTGPQNGSQGNTAASDDKPRRRSR